MESVELGTKVVLAVQGACAEQMTRARSEMALDETGQSEVSETASLIMTERPLDMGPPDMGPPNL